MGLNELMPERLVWEWQLVDVCLSCGQNVMRTVYTYIPIIRVLYNGGLAPKRCDSSALALELRLFYAKPSILGPTPHGAKVFSKSRFEEICILQCGSQGKYHWLIGWVACYISLQLSIVLVNYGISSAYALDILQFTDQNESTLVLRCIVSGVTSVYRWDIDINSTLVLNMHIYTRMEIR